MILTIKDETVKALMDHHKIGSLAGAVAYINRVIERASRDNLEGALALSSETVSKLRDMLGGFVAEADLVDRVRRIGRVRVQGHEYVLTSEQLARLKQEAFGHARNGEPRKESEATPAQAEEIVQRYMTEQIDYFMKAMCSQL